VAFLESLERQRLETLEGMKMKRVLRRKKRAMRKAKKLAKEENYSQFYGRMY
jgi:hypothetical protein